MKSIHRLSTVLAALTFLLVTLGGVVHNTGSSLACPDWPLCFGQVFPKMVGSVAIEHSHRLLAALVGLLTLLLAFLAARHRHHEPKLFWLAMGAAFLVIFQGVLGGVTVLLKIHPLVSTAHLATSQIFLATMTTLALLSAEAPQAQPSWGLDEKFGKLLRLSALCLFLQMVLGAFIRHSGASVACGLGSADFFSCSAEADTGIPSIPAWFNLAHRYFAIVTALLVVGATLPLLRFARIHRLSHWRQLAIACHGLLVVQVGLGLWALASNLDRVIVTLHLVVAMSLWMILITLCVWASQSARQALSSARPTFRNFKTSEVV